MCSQAVLTWGEKPQVSCSSYIFPVSHSLTSHTTREPKAVTILIKVWMFWFILFNGERLGLFTGHLTWGYSIKAFKEFPPPSFKFSAHLSPQGFFFFLIINFRLSNIEYWIFRYSLFSCMWHSINSHKYQRKTIFWWHFTKYSNFRTTWCLEPFMWFKRAQRRDNHSSQFNLWPVLFTLSRN